MNAEDLRYFLAVRETRSITGAAHRLKVDPATVNRRLAALEEWLAASLFERTADGMFETDVARAITPLAERIELMTHALHDTAQAASDAPTGPVRIATSPLVADHFLIPRVPELMRRFPNIPLDVHADIARVDVLRRQADLAIRQHPIGKAPAEPSALAMRLGQFAFAAYASPDYIERHGRPDPARGLKGHLMISMGVSGPGNAWNERLPEPADYVLSVYPLSATTTAAENGIGIAVLPCLGADSNPRLVRLTESIPAYDLWLVSSHQVRNNARVRAIKDALLEMLQAAAPELDGTAGWR